MRWRLACILSALAVWGVTAQQGNNDLIGSVTIERLELLGAGTDRVQFAVTPSVVARKAANIRRIVFEDVRIGSIPVYLPPMLDRVEVAAGQPIPVRRPLTTTVFFRDLEDLAPLEEMLSKGRAPVEGRLIVDVDVGLLPTILTFTRTVRVPLNFTGEIPVNPPGGELGKTASLALLRAAQTALSLYSATRVRFEDPKSSRHEMMRQYLPLLLIVQSQLQVQNREGSREPYIVTGLGFRIDGNSFLTTREMAQPWAFDADLAGALKTGSLKIVKGSENLLVWPANASDITEASALTLARKQLKLSGKNSASKEVMVMQSGNSGYSRLRVEKRDSSANVALWEFAGSPLAALPAIEHLNDFATTERLGVFRLPLQREGRRPPELVFLLCRRDGTRILLDEPIDTGARGSPVFSANGLIGMVQDENSGIMLNQALRSLSVAGED